MRLFGKVSGTIDNYDRAMWMTVPFDKDIFSIPVGSGLLIRAAMRETLTVPKRQTVKPTLRENLIVRRRGQGTNG